MHVDACDLVHVQNDSVLQKFSEAWQIRSERVIARTHRCKKVCTDFIGFGGLAIVPVAVRDGDSHIRQNSTGLIRNDTG